jgi:hypothetical protein
MWQGLGRGILWFLVGKLEGTNSLKVLGFYERLILSGSARNGSILDRDDLCLDTYLCQVVVKNIANHLVERNVWNCLTEWGTARLSGRILLSAFSYYFVKAHRMF